MTVLRKATPERLSAFSDGVFAVLITVLVLELRPPEVPTFQALLLLWPTWLSYAVSYLFIAIVWTNHHYLVRYATEATPRLVWFNFAHLFSMSLLPLSTAWMAVSDLAPQPVAFYAAVFFLVNATYICLIWELLDRVPVALELHAGLEARHVEQVGDQAVEPLRLLADRLLELAPGRLVQRVAAQQRARGARDVRDRRRAVRDRARRLGRRLTALRRGDRHGGAARRRQPRADV